MFKLLNLRTMGVLIGVIAVFASVGMAASFKINDGDDLINAEGETLVETCDRDVEVEKWDKWVNPTGAGEENQLGGYFAVYKIKVNADSDCYGENVAVILTDCRGDEIARAEDELDGNGNADLNFYDDDIAISDLHDVHVLIGGKLHDGSGGTGASSCEPPQHSGGS